MDEARMWAGQKKRDDLQAGHKALAGHAVILPGRDCRAEPCSDYLLLRKAEAAEEANKVLLPHDVQKKIRPLVGTVLKAGPKVNEGTVLEIKPGDVVAYGQFAENVLAIDHAEIVVVRADDVICVIPPVPEPEPQPGDIVLSDYEKSCL